jgi:hypothetical protein
VSDIIGVFVFVPGWKEVVIRTPPAKRYQDFSMWGHKDSSRKERGSLLMAMSLLMAFDKLPRYV